MQTCKLKQIYAECEFAPPQYLFLNNFLYRQAHCYYTLQRAIPKSLVGFVILRSQLNQLNLPLGAVRKGLSKCPRFLSRRRDGGKKGVVARSLEMPEVLAGALRAALPWCLQHQ